MIYPYSHNKIYESSNLIKCAKQFYKQIKTNKETCSYFILKDIDSNQIYNFKINKNMQIGGGLKKNIIKTQDLSSIESKIDNLLTKMEKLGKYFETYDK